MAESPPAPGAERPSLRLLWAAMLDCAQLSDQTARDLYRLEPVSWQDGILVFRASTGDVAWRVRRLASMLCNALGLLAPVPLEGMVIMGPLEP